MPYQYHLTSNKIENYFGTMVFKMEVDAYVNRRSVLKENIQKAYYLMLRKCTEMLKPNSSVSRGGARHLTNLMSSELSRSSRP